MSIRNNEESVNVKLSEEAHAALEEEARKRYGDANAVTWSALIQDLVDEARSNQSNNVTFVGD